MTLDAVAGIERLSLRNDQYDWLRAIIYSVSIFRGAPGVMGMPKPQQEFLRDAMSRLGMTRDQFAERIGTKKRTLDNWLLSSESAEYRGMPDMAWKFVREILENHK